MGVSGKRSSKEARDHSKLGMDSIKKKMEKLASETAEAEGRIKKYDEIKAGHEQEAEKFEEQVRNLQKKAGNAENEVSALRGRLILLQENNEKQEERLCKSTLELAGACMRADQSVRQRIELENGVSSNEESIDNLDKQLSEAKITLSDSESKYEDISRKMATLEADAAKGNERA